MYLTEHMIFYLQVTRLCDLSQDNDTVTSVSWSERVSVSISAVQILMYTSQNTLLPNVQKPKYAICMKENYLFVIGFLKLVLFICC